MRTKNTDTTTVQTAGTTTAPREVTPKLKCLVTGKDRLTNKAYLESKASAAGVTVPEFLGLYISRGALKLLREGKSVDETRQALNVTVNEPISAELLARAIQVNGKHKGE